MPIYEYQCQSCHHTFDVLQKISDTPPKHCPQCDSSKVTKLVSAAGFQLKGSGWYVTDFKDKPQPKTTAQPESKSKDQSQSAPNTSKDTSS